jgi:hypothetical protein
MDLMCVRSIDAELLKIKVKMAKGPAVIIRKRGVGLDSPFATLLLIALPDFVIAVVVVIFVGCHSKHSFDSMV